MTRKKRPSRSPEAKPFSAATALEGYQKWLSPAEYELLKQELGSPLLPTIRPNPLKTSRDFPDFLIHHYGWKLEPVPFCVSGYQVETGEGPLVSNTLEHRLGLYYVQEAASMLPVELFDLSPSQPGLSLDMAASPGGKTTHLVSRLSDQGLVIANDSSQGRIQALRVVLQNWGAANLAVTCLPGERYGNLYPGTFDRVLLDAPCSMQGLRTTESHPVKTVTDRESRQLASRQAALLRSAIHALRPGGEAVYSTCTLLPQEDELVVDCILKEFQGKIELEDAQLRLPVAAPGLTNYDGNSLFSGMERTIRLWPHRYHTAGFFACLIKKTGETEPPENAEKTNPGKITTPAFLSDKEAAEFYRSFEDQYGYELGEYCESQGFALVRYFERITLYPDKLASQFPQLPTTSFGMLLGEETPDGFLPSFEWISRFGSRCSTNLIRLDGLQVKQWMSGRNLPFSTEAIGARNRFRILLDQRGMGLGCGKITANELKNLLPRRMVYP